MRNTMGYRIWQPKPLDEQAAAALQQSGCGRLLSRVLAARGCQTPQQAAALLEGETPLSDPFAIRDMDKAVERLHRAVEEGETIVIYGDYDVDGVTATAILYEYLTNLGAQVRCKLPLRTEGGYGMNKDALKKLADKGYTLIVTVDNGIAAVEEAAYARELGIDLVITDHHLPSGPLPDAAAVVDPNRPDDESGCGSLCGAGVAFKLCAAMEGCDPAEMLDVCGDLAAIGTVADVVPLVGGKPHPGAGGPGPAGGHRPPRPGRLAGSRRLRRQARHRRDDRLQHRPAAQRRRTHGHGRHRLKAAFVRERGAGRRHHRPPDRDQHRPPAHRAGGAGRRPGPAGGGTRPRP